MRTNRLPLLLGGVAILLGIAYFAGVFDGDFSTVDVPELALETESISAITLEGPSIDAAIRLERDGTTWQMTAPITHPADSFAVTQFLRDLDGVALTSVVTFNADRHATYGVDDSSAVLVSLDGTNLPDPIYVGNPSSDFRATYVRLGEDERVFLTESRLNIQQDLDRWRDKRVIRLSPQRIISVQVVTPEDAYLATTTDGWQLTQNDTTTTADSAKVVAWLQRFNPLRADGFADDLAPSTVEQAATHTLTFTVADGSTTTLLLQPREADVVLTDGRVVYRLTGLNRLDTLLPFSSSLM